MRRSQKAEGEKDNPPAGASYLPPSALAFLFSPTSLPRRCGGSSGARATRGRRGGRPHKASAASRATQAARGRQYRRPRPRRPAAAGRQFLQHRPGHRGPRRQAGQPGVDGEQFLRPGGLKPAVGIAAERLGDHVAALGVHGDGSVGTSAGTPAAMVWRVSTPRISAPTA